MEPLNNGYMAEFLPGDTIVAEEGEYLVISAQGFDLSDEGSEARYILVDVKEGIMEGYLYSLNELWETYSVIAVEQNHKSLARYVNNTPYKG